MRRSPQFGAHAAEAGGKPVTGALPHRAGRDDRVGVWIDARDVIHVAVGNPNGVGSDGLPVGRAGNRNLPDRRRCVTRQPLQTNELRQGLWVLASANSIGMEETNGGLRRLRLIHPNEESAPQP